LRVTSGPVALAGGHRPERRVVIQGNPLHFGTRKSMVSRTTRCEKLVALQQPLQDAEEFPA